MNAKALNSDGVEEIFKLGDEQSVEIDIFNMEIKRIWLIDHKASLGEFSPMNLDGSSWILGICVLSAKSQEEASIKFNVFLKDEDMELLELYELCEYKAENFKDNSRRSNQVHHAASSVNHNDEICYVYARTSEAMTYEVNKDK